MNDYFAEQQYANQIDAAMMYGAQRKLRSCQELTALIGLHAYGAANAYRTPQQQKLDAAREFLKQRAEHHPEWQVRRADEILGRVA